MEGTFRAKSHIPGFLQTFLFACYISSLAQLQELVNLIPPFTPFPSYPACVCVCVCCSWHCGIHCQAARASSVLNDQVEETWHETLVRIVCFKTSMSVLVIFF